MPIVDRYSVRYLVTSTKTNKNTLDKLNLRVQRSKLNNTKLLVGNDNCITHDGYIFTRYIF